MIRIYYKDRFITVTREKSESDDAGFQAIAFDQSCDPKISIKEFLANKNLTHLNFYGTAPERGLAILKTSLKHILAAGGIVLNEEGKKLFIYRNSKWDLPKGKAEAGETAEICAIREVSEECGLDINELNIEKKLGNTYHIYTQNGDTILKTTAWFSMKYTGNGNCLIPQLEENIEKCVWVKDKKIPKMMKNTYASIRRFMKTHYPEVL